METEKNNDGKYFLTFMVTMTMALMLVLWIDDIQRDCQPMKNRPVIQLSKAAPLLMGGDVILTRGRTSLASAAISMAQRHEFTHIALVLKDPISGTLWIASSNEGSGDHAENGLLDWRGLRHQDGVRIFDLFDYIKAYTSRGGSVFVRALDPPADPFLVWNVAISLQGTPYPPRPWLSLPSAFLCRNFPSLFGGEKDGEEGENSLLGIQRRHCALHCAATVTRILGTCGIIRPEAIAIRPCYQWLPKDYADDRWLAQVLGPTGHSLRTIVKIVF